MTVDQVRVDTLDSFELREVDLIKIDVEGWELPVVHGAVETLRKWRPIVVCEQKGNDELGYGHQPQAALHFLRSIGMAEKRVISGDYIMGW